MKMGELISVLTDGRKEFLNLIEDISRDEMEIPGVIELLSLKDLLVHLIRWEAELVKLLWQAKQGVKPTTVHFNQNSVDAINERWYQEGKLRAMEIVWKDFIGVRQQTLRRIQELAENELNDPQYYPWLKGKALWQWIAADSFEHEAEHAADIQAWKTRMDKTS